MRKPERGEEPPEQLVECCWCAALGPETDLQCGGCQNQIPFCVVTGKRMLLADWTTCPSCRFPARMADLTALAAAGGTCPMCAAQLTACALTATLDPLAPYRSGDAENRAANR